MNLDNINSNNKKKQCINEKLGIKISPHKVSNIIKIKLNNYINNKLIPNDLDNDNSTEKDKILENYNIGGNVNYIISIICNKVANELLDIAINNITYYVEKSIYYVDCEVFYNIHNIVNNNIINVIENLKKISTYPLINNLILEDEYINYINDKNNSNIEIFTSQYEEFEKNKYKIRGENILLGIVNDNELFSENNMLAHSITSDIQKIFEEKKSNNLCSPFVFLKENLCFLISYLLLMLIFKLIDISFYLMEFKNIKTIQDNIIIRSIKILYNSTQKEKDKKSFDDLLNEIKYKLNNIN
jgi:hypothetical protein